MDQDEPLYATIFYTVSKSPRRRYLIFEIQLVAVIVILILVLLSLAVEKRLLPAGVIPQVELAAFPIRPSRRSSIYPQTVEEEGVLAVHSSSPSQNHPSLPSLDQYP